MTVNVRIFTYPELLVAKVSSAAGRPVQDALFLLKEPYLGNELLLPTTLVVATSAAATAPKETSLLKVQLDLGKRVYYEVTPANLATVRLPTTASPILNDNDLVFFAQNYRISFLEVT